jgi:hypothetical protein
MTEFRFISIGYAGHTWLIFLQTVVNINQWAAYHSADNFSHSEKFIPERWLGDARFENDKQDVFQPFSVGPRNCIGQRLVPSGAIKHFFFQVIDKVFRFAYDSMKLVLSRMLWRFDLEFEENETATNWLKDHSVFTSFHLPPLNVSLHVKA